LRLKRYHACHEQPELARADVGGAWLALDHWGMCRIERFRGPCYNDFRPMWLPWA
jgi:hypothetical protein